MKRLLISTAAVALMSSAAFAADLPVFEEAPVVAPVADVYDWSGFYVGLHVGGAFLTEDDDDTLSYSPGFVGLFCPTGVGGGATQCPTGFDDDEDDGFLAGGGHAGIQGQWGMWVAGIEADITYLDLDDDVDDDDGDGFGNNAVVRNPGVLGFPDVFSASGSDPFGDDDDEENNLLGTVRGKVGVAFDRVLIYGTGGLALTSAENTESFVGIGRNPVVGAAQPFLFTFTDVDGDGDDDEDIALGFAAGGGIDWAVTDNFIIGAQALYFNIDDGDDDEDDVLTCNATLSAGGCGVPTAAGAAVAVDGDNAFEGVIATVRGSYKFNFGGNM